MALHRVLVPICLFLLAGLPEQARSETFDTCTGFVDTLPASISTQGTWCLRRDLSTAASSGAAITIAANNVTIDCNGFKLGGLAAGNASQAIGVRADDRQNATVRNCGIRGFLGGVLIQRGKGHLVEDNRFDNNLSTGIMMVDYGGTANIGTIRRNRILDTGGAADAMEAYGIYANADILDNTIDGVLAGGAHAAYGIWVRGQQGPAVTGNIVRNLLSGPGGQAHGIYIGSYLSRIRGNHLVAQDAYLVSTQGPASGSGITAGGSAQGPYSVCEDNVVSGFSVGIGHCTDGGGNRTLP